MVFTVVVRQLFSGLDGTLSHDKNPPPAVESFAVGPTGMIDVTSRIITRTAIDIVAGANTENIAVIECITLTDWDSFPNILDDRSVFFDRRDSKQTEARFGSFDCYMSEELFWHRSIVHLRQKKNCPYGQSFIR